MIALILETFPEEPIMVKVARGESDLKQWHEDGRVVKGQVTPADRGLFQINLGYHGAQAKRLGLDIEGSIVDNVKMARHIYDTQGITAWVFYNNHLSYVDTTN